MSTLYELTDDFIRLLIAAEALPEDGEGIFADALDAVHGEISDKAEGLCYVMADLNAEVDKFKAEERRLADRRRSIEKNIERLKNYLKDNMISAGFQKLNAGTFKVSIGKPMKKVSVTDEDALPEMFVIVSKRPAKAELAKALKGGAIIAGAELVDGSPIIRIR